MVYIVKTWLLLLTYEMWYTSLDGKFFIKMTDDKGVIIVLKRINSVNTTCEKSAVLESHIWQIYMMFYNILYMLYE